MVLTTEDIERAKTTIQQYCKHVHKQYDDADAHCILKEMNGRCPIYGGPAEDFKVESEYISRSVLMRAVRNILMFCRKPCWSRYRCEKQKCPLHTGNFVEGERSGCFLRLRDEATDRFLAAILSTMPKEAAKIRETMLRSILARRRTIKEAETKS